MNVKTRTLGSNLTPDASKTRHGKKYIADTFEMINRLGFTGKRGVPPSPNRPQIPHALRQGVILRSSSKKAQQHNVRDGRCQISGTPRTRNVLPMLSDTL
eukprot:2872491-Amphidinium_carterae.1